MTDGVKIGLIVGGVGLFAVIALVIATRPTAAADPGATFQQPVQPTVQEDSTAGVVRGIGTALVGGLTAVTTLVNNDRQRAADAAARAADRTATLEDRRYCTDNPNAASCRPAGSNGGSGTASRVN